MFSISRISIQLPQNESRGNQSSKDLWGNLLRVRNQTQVEQENWSHATYAIGGLDIRLSTTLYFSPNEKAKENNTSHYQTSGREIFIFTSTANSWWASEPCVSRLTRIILTDSMVRKSYRPRYAKWLIRFIWIWQKPTILVDHYSKRHSVHDEDFEPLYSTCRQRLVKQYRKTLCSIALCWDASDFWGGSLTSTGSWTSYTFPPKWCRCNIFTKELIAFITAVVTAKCPRGSLVRGFVDNSNCWSCLALQKSNKQRLIQLFIKRCTEYILQRVNESF